jgi:hypothetical protein
VAAGDVYAGISSIANNAYLDIQPSSGVEAVIHDVYYAGAVEFHFYDGTNDINFDSDSSAGARLGMTWHCTNSVRVRIKNTSGGTMLIGYDGVQTK